ncbi:hypothetical protein [Streptomyces sp. XH2]|uniref:hypothetical protein n=1 Tax=Streptomyces sp. XH2 TaxID=3412483 RepID=UPI003C798D9D
MRIPRRAAAAATAVAVLAVPLTSCAGSGGPAGPESPETPFQQGRRFGLAYSDKLSGDESDAQVRAAARTMCKESVLLQAAAGGEDDWFRACLYAATARNGGVPSVGSVHETP